MKARVVNIQRFSLHDGPGIRTLVFFKGCPLKCLWCANPECISPVPELGFSRILCNRCGNCFSECPEGAIAADADEKPIINRRSCNNCGRCVSVCPEKALTIYGREITLEELLEEVSGDQMFFDHSEGGVTISGGEPLLQADCLTALFKRCKEANISTAIETCGYVTSEAFRDVLELTDFVFYDLKTMDSRKHLNFTGKPNDLILENARIVAKSGIPLQFRMPLIPGLNDDFDNIQATSHFLHQLSTKKDFSLELMPYHRLGVGKYEALGQTYSLTGLPSADLKEVELACQRFKGEGITCIVSS